MKSNVQMVGNFVVKFCEELLLRFVIDCFRLLQGGSPSGPGPPIYLTAKELADGEILVL